MVNEWYLVAFWQDLKIKIHLIHNYSFQKVKRLGPLHLAKKVISWSPPPFPRKMVVDWHGVVEFVEYTVTRYRNPTLNILIIKTYPPILYLIICITVRLGLFFIL